MSRDQREPGAGRRQLGDGGVDSTERGQGDVDARVYPIGHSLGEKGLECCNEM